MIVNCKTITGSGTQGPATNQRWWMLTLEAGGIGGYVYVTGISYD